MLLGDLAPHIVRAGDVVLDVGANIGQSAMVFCPLVGPLGRCLSFEPEPRAFDSLARLAAEPDFQNLEPYCRAISDSAGHVVLAVGSAQHARQASTVIGELAVTDRLGTISRYRVETDTLDAFCERRSLAPSVLKVDVEGAEARVFAGARRVIAAHRPVVVLEFGPGGDRGVPPHLEFLESLDYRFYVMEITIHHGSAAYLERPASERAPVAPADLVRHELGGNLLSLPPARIDAIASIVQRPFAADARDVRWFQPDLLERICTRLREVEGSGLAAVSVAYQTCRNGSVSVARGVLRSFRRPSQG